VGNYLGRTGKCTPKERELALKNVAEAEVLTTDYTDEHGWKKSKATEL